MKGEWLLLLLLHCTCSWHKVLTQWLLYSLTCWNGLLLLMEICLRLLLLWYQRMKLARALSMLLHRLVQGTRWELVYALRLTTVSWRRCIMRSTSHVSPTCSDHFRMMMLDCRVHNYGPFSSDCSLWRLLNLFFLMKGTWCWWSVNVLLMHNNVCVYICSWKDTGGINRSSLVLLLHSCIKCVRCV